MKSRNLRKIYIDSNVLINYCTGQPQEKAALNHLFKIRRKELLFTSSLALVQTITNLQTSKKNRSPFSHEKTAELVNCFISKMTVIDLTVADIEKGNTYPNFDIEDNIHYVLSQKCKCDVIITNNKKDFVFFRDIDVIKPDMHLISMRIK